MRAYEVKVIHKSDWTYKLFGSGVDLHTIHAEVSSRSIDECVVIDLLKIRRSDANAFSKTIQAIKSNWRVISCQLVASMEGEMLVQVVSKCQDSVRFILNSHKIPVVRSMVRNGVEIYTVLAQDKHHIDSAAKEMQSISEIIDIRPIALREVLLYAPTEKIKVPKLAKREKEILGTALREGFFEHPKRIKIENIARIHGVSKAYISVTIRKAVRKALEWLVETDF